MKKIIYCLTAILLVIGSSASAETLQLEGSTTVGPIADAFAEYFKSIYPDLQITVKKTGSGDGAAALVDNRSLDIEIASDTDGYLIHHKGISYHCLVEDELTNRLRTSMKQSTSNTIDHTLRSPMPGLILSIAVSPGQRVETGERLMVIEAMKMENEIKAPFRATVKTIKVKEGQAVEFDQPLIIFE